jgi:CRP-like cAMP-binding protein
MATGNRLLDSLPPDVLQAVTPHLELIHMPHGASVMYYGRAVEFVYFPITSLVSLVAMTESGNMVEASTVGNDGFVGIPALLSHPAIAATGGMIQIEGDALRMSVAQFRQDIQDQRLRDVLGAYALWVIAVSNQSAACMAFHPVQERLARWLLMVRHSTGLNEFPLTQDLLAVMLGSHRPTVSIAIAALENAGFIQHRRGRITILDGLGLESASCECFAMTQALLKDKLL